MDFPVTREHLSAYLNLAPSQQADQDAMDRAADAASTWVLTRVLGAPDPTPTEVPADTFQGTVMLAARWYNRRSSVNGIAGFADAGVAYVMRNDPDIGQLLGLGRPRAR